MLFRNPPTLPCHDEIVSGGNDLGSEDEAQLCSLPSSGRHRQPTARTQATMPYTELLERPHVQLTKQFESEYPNTVDKQGSAR